LMPRSGSHSIFNNASNRLATVHMASQTPGHRAPHFAHTLRKTPLRNIDNRFESALQELVKEHFDLPDFTFD
jgi:hypothetical protein